MQHCMLRPMCCQGSAREALAPKPQEASEGPLRLRFGPHLGDLGSLLVCTHVEALREQVGQGRGYHDIACQAAPVYSLGQALACQPASRWAIGSWLLRSRVLPSLCRMDV